MAPVVPGVSAGSKTKPGSRNWPVKVGATSVPVGPSAASKRVDHRGGPAGDGADAPQRAVDHHQTPARQAQPLQIGRELRGGAGYAAARRGLKHLPAPSSVFEPAHVGDGVAGVAVEEIGVAAGAEDGEWVGGVR